jgi:hypothetical protein
MVRGEFFDGITGRRRPRLVLMAREWRTRRGLDALVHVHVSICGGHTDISLLGARRMALGERVVFGVVVQTGMPREQVPVARRM